MHSRAKLGKLNRSIFHNLSDSYDDAIMFVEEVKHLFLLNRDFLKRDVLHINTYQTLTNTC